MGLAHQAKLPIRETWSGAVSVRDGATIVWSGAIAGEVKRFYTAYQELDRVQVMGGATVRYNRDADGLVTSVTDVGGQSLPTLSLPRAPSDGRITGTTQGAVTTTLDYGRDGAGLTFGQVASWSASGGGNTVLQSSYGYDDVGRITRWAQSGAGGYSQVHRYRYDDAGRLTDVLDDAGSELEHYGYDANGNRTEVRRVGEPTEEYRCDATHAATSDDRLCEVDGRTYTYDARGMLASVAGPDGTATFRYDGMGRLHKATTAAGDVIYYAHDAFGRRIARIKNGQLDKGWIYANGLSPIAQLNGLGQLEATYVYASRPNIPDFIVERAGASNVTYRVIADHLGTPRRLVRTSDGVVVYALDVDEWGRMVNESGTKSALVPFGFAGGLWDRDTGLVRFGARDYDPETGRWTARDPVLFAGGQTNLYAYVGNDPVNFVDPSGLESWDQTLMDASAGFGDALLFNQGSRLRAYLGIDGVNPCSSAYDWSGPEKVDRALCSQTA